MSAPEIIHRLVEQFKRDYSDYTSNAYNEAQLRQEFLDPFFGALGWDVNNKQGFAMQYREVVHEDRIDIDGSKKAPDYAFRIGGVRKFFVEAKKPAENIETDARLAYQLRRYAWNAHLPLSILTDFEEFAVYDCRNRPDPGDGSATSRIKMLRYEDYIDQWDEIVRIFSPDAIRKGAFDKFAADNTGKKGTIKVDDAFLADIESWRTLLARNIALRNPQVADERQLNFAVQMVIDRIIFLRICEDREIEPENQLLEVSQGKEIYARLKDLFQRADQRYNSGLFHFKEESGQTSPEDTLTPTLVVDDKVLKEIIKDLYYPSPYIFKEIPVEILGQVYEQFLGKVIRLTSGHHAKVEEKPEVRKAGGVYYTPKYIVDYIVENTVDKLLEGRTPKEAADLKIVDPACGSGSFLLGAFQSLLRWHEDWYLKHDPGSWSKGSEAALVPTPDGEWRISTAAKKRILLNNIFGVDIDAQAVEVTKLSLLLKVLEGETGQLTLGFERVLPDLGQNIQCGNSLIGPDYYEGKQMGLFNEDELYRINAFDWEAAFPAVFARGGFDAVIGNPPYIRIQSMKEWAPIEVEFYKERYKSASKGNYDIYVVFVERGLSILNEKGILGFILPNKFFNSKYGEPLREIISDGRNLKKIIHFGDQQVFSNATTYTCLLFLDKLNDENFKYKKVDDLGGWMLNQDETDFVIRKTREGSKEWNYFLGDGAILAERLYEYPMNLGRVTNIFVGLQTSADDFFILDLISENKDFYRLYSRVNGSEVELEKSLLYPIISGTDVERFSKLNKRQFILFPYLVDKESYELIEFNQICNNFPRIAAYFNDHKNMLQMREKGRMKNDKWYGFVYHKNMTKQKIKKVCVPRLVDYLYGTLDSTGTFFLDNVDVGGVVYKDEYKKYDLHYLLGLINSKLMRWYFPKISATFRGGWYSANRQFLSKLPFYIIDSQNSTENKKYERVIMLVNQMIELSGQIKNLKTPNDKTRLQRQIDAADAEIDRLVYDLYGLTDDEIRIVEESVK